MIRTLAAVLLLVTPAAAHDIVAGSLQVIHPVIVKAFPAARTAAGYLTIANDGDEPDLLIGIRIEGVSASLHESREDGGVARMVPLEAVEVRAGDVVTFEQGGMHVMLMGLAPGQFAPGDMVNAILIFDRQGEVAVPFMVEGMQAAGGHAGHMGN